MSDNLLQQKYLELHEIEQHIKTIQQQATLLQQQLVEILSMIEHIDSLGRVKSSTKTYTSLGPGVFVASELKDTQHLLVNVGAGVLVKKGLEDAKNSLLQQAEDVRSMRRRLEQELQRLGILVKSMREEMQTLAGRDAKV